MPSQKTPLDAAQVQLLTEEEVNQRLKEIPHWKQEGKTLVRVEKFHNYLDGLKFINRVGFASEENDHHPDIKMNYKQVEIRYSTHSAGGLTPLDFKMAKKVEDILASLV